MTTFKTYTCEWCDRVFDAQLRAKNKPQPKYCSLACSAESRKGKPSKNNKQIPKQCESCDRTYFIPLSRKDTATSCSDECRQALHGMKVIKHGKSKSKVYAVWANMKKRCTNPNDPNWKYYGGRGIIVCKEWLDSFEAFYQYMGDPSQGLTIDRIDNDGNYEPGNVRWADYVTQSFNSRRWQR